MRRGRAAASAPCHRRARWTGRPRRWRRQSRDGSRRRSPPERRARSPASRRAPPARGADPGSPASSTALLARVPPRTASARAPRPWRRPCARSRARPRSAVAPGLAGCPAPSRSRRPGRPRLAISGRPSSGSGREHQAWLRVNWLSMPRVCAARPRVVANISISSSRSSGVSMSSAERGAPRPPRAWLPARWRGRCGAGGCPRRRRAVIASGGVSSSALVPSPWRSGTISTDRAGTGRSISSLELGGVQQRAVAGDEQRPCRAHRQGPRDAELRGLAVARGRVLDHDRLVPGGDLRRDRIGGDDEDLIDRRHAAHRQHRVGEHRLDQRAAAARAAPSAPGAAWRSRTALRAGLRRRAHSAGKLLGTGAFARRSELANSSVSRRQPPRARPGRPSAGPCAALVPAARPARR